MTRYYCCVLAILFFVPPTSAFAIDSESDRESIVSAKSKKFYQSNSTRQYLSLGGKFDSDQDSKSYGLNSRYLYQSNKAIHELNFEHETDYGKGAKGQNQLVKKSQFTEFSTANKFIISNSKNYGVFFHKTMHDPLSKYHRDMRTAAGIGRIFFDNKVELDGSFGYHNVIAYGRKVSFIPSIRINLKINKELSLVQRSYLYLDHKSMDNELKTSLIYRINPQTSFEIRHTFEQRRYGESNTRVIDNQCRRLITIGLVFDLG